MHYRIAPKKKKKKTQKGQRKSFSFFRVFEEHAGRLAFEIISSKFLYKVMSGWYPQNHPLSNYCVWQILISEASFP